MWSGLVTFTALPGSLRGATPLPQRVITLRQGLRGRTGPLPTEPELQDYPCGMDQSMKKSDWLVGATSPSTQMSTAPQDPCQAGRLGHGPGLCSR